GNPCRKDVVAEASLKSGRSLFAGVMPSLPDGQSLKLNQRQPWLPDFGNPPAFPDRGRLCRDEPHY
ncbi:MAG: hypothetical protein Q7U30_05410, partial [Methylicorpusculum sp.]|nr:hypothetical protein [Methylicorpusculum sp.]